MNFKIITLGKIEKKFQKQAIEEYSKRLSRYTKIQLINCKNINQILKKVNKGTYIINVNKNGNQISSEQLAEKISDLGVKGQSNLTFIILNNMENIPMELAEKINYSLSISKMDIDTNIKLVILFEQIYRAFRIIKNEPYHK